MGSGLMFSLVAWCVRMRGPLFVSVFQPLMLVIVAVAGSLFLDEKLRVGMYAFIFILFFHSITFIEQVGKSSLE